MNISSISENTENGKITSVTYTFENVEPERDLGRTIEDVEAYLCCQYRKVGLSKQEREGDIFVVTFPVE